MTRPVLVAAGTLILFCVWVWPLPQLGAPPFSSHMTMHMAVVAIAAPLLALGLAGGRCDVVVRAPRVFSAIPVSIAELITVWAWHSPALHHAARHQWLGLVLEQAMFLLAGYVLWSAALGGSAEQRRARALSGVTGLLLTSMHMTLLGALIALTPRLLYGHAHHHGGSLSPLLDQQLGGAIMLLVGGAVYLAGGLGLSADAFLRERRA